MKFQIKLKQTTTEEATVTVEAESEEEAIDNAWDLADDNKLAWKATVIGNYEVKVEEL